MPEECGKEQMGWDNIANKPPADWCENWGKLFFPYWIYKLAKRGKNNLFICTMAKKGEIVYSYSIT